MSLTCRRKIIGLLPEVEDLVKMASLDSEFPLDNKCNVITSYLEHQYRTKIAGEYIPESITAKLEKAAELYGVKDRVDILTDNMVHRNKSMMEKAASESIEEMVKAAEILFEGNFEGLFNLEKAAYQAEELVDQYGDYVTSEEVLKYAGNAELSKSAAIQALAYRSKLTKNLEFVKIAKVIDATDVSKLDSDDIRVICRSVMALDKKAGLLPRGFNFYNEALITKSAAVTNSYHLTIDLGGKSYPYEDVIKLGKKNISDIVGADVGASLTDDPATNKAILDSLPNDLKQLLATYLK